MLLNAWDLSKGILLSEMLKCVAPKSLMLIVFSYTMGGAGSAEVVALVISMDPRNLGFYGVLSCCLWKRSKTGGFIVLPPKTMLVDCSSFLSFPNSSCFLEYSYR